ncbi:MAG: Trm112 family protein [Candidatus Aenigmarchaeota archaeon]|nr:Trm112 family protein [Candidatus Aenigmarchaeota archaeon]
MPKDLLSIVVCPRCKGELKMARHKLDCKNCRLRFGFVTQDIPKMIIEEAEQY